MPWAIATSGYRESAGPVLERLDVPAEVPVITRDAVEHAKPDPDLFLAAASRLGVDIANAMVIGDSVWDMLAARRARALGVGFLSGGYGQEDSIGRARIELRLHPGLAPGTWTRSASVCPAARPQTISAKV